MIKNLYLAIEQLLLAITDEQPQPQHIFKHCDLWNRQVEFIEQETPFLTPAIFVEFLEIPWQTDGRSVQDADLTIRLHIVTPWFANTASDIADTAVRSAALAYLDLPTVLFRKLHGKHGDIIDNTDTSHPVTLGSFNALTRIASRPNHDHERFVDSVETYRCHIKDFTFSNPTFPVDVVGLSIEFDPHPGQQS